MLGSCVSTLNLRCYRAHCELKVALNRYIANTKLAGNVWDETIYPFPHFNGAIVGVWARISN